MTGIDGYVDGRESTFTYKTAGSVKSFWVENLREIEIEFGYGHSSIGLPGHFDKTIKTDSASTFSAEIVVYRWARKISHRVCDNDASIRQEAYEHVTKEAYRSIGLN